MADQPNLKIAIGTYGHTRALKWGDVRIDGVDPAFVEVVPIIGAFRRMVRDVEFDICEMAPTTYMIARALGAPYIALPIFLMRRFHHGGFVVRPDAGIKVPKDLEGKKVGVRAYSVTTGVWTRGIFVNEYGLDSSKVTWVVDDEEHVTTLKLPPNVVHAPEGKSLQSMMKAGEIQAGFTGPAGVGRAGPPISGWDKAGAAAAAADTYPELIADVEKVEADWFRNSGIYPIHGLIVVKDEHIKRYPWLARSLMNAFVAAKKPYLEQLRQGQSDSPEDKRYRGFLSLMSDPLPYGSAANRASIEALVTYSLQQKLIPARPQLDQVFVDIDP
jgi:4,5-dihydroxyphthalate decarboxylase